MSHAVRVAKIGKRADSSDPNDFIFHSDYNTFKIVVEGILPITHNGSPATQIFTYEHGLKFIPLSSAFIKVSGETQAYPPNGYGVVTATAKALVSNGVEFDYVEADKTNVYFSITTSSSKTIDIKYYLLEKI